MRFRIAVSWLGLAAMVACQRNQEQKRYVVAQQPGGLPAPGVTLWCTHELPSDEPTHRHEIRRVPAVSDAQGKLSFAGDPDECGLSAEGAEAQPSNARPTASGTPVRVTPRFSCSSALLLVSSREHWLLSWYSRERGFTEVKSVAPGAMTAAVEELWRANGEHRDPNDRRLDCALIVSGGNSQQASLAARELKRPFESGAGSALRPALETHLWDPEAVCAWTSGRLPNELRTALGDPFSCRNVPR